MSKGNPFLGFARGKVGDVVFYRLNGEQITRARNRSPKNPKSPLQQLQRICANSSSKAYSFLKDICNHSFEGLAPGTPCQSEFNRVNIELLRNKLAYEIAYPFDDVMRDSQQANYNRKGDTTPVANEWQVSSGSLRPLSVSTTSGILYRVAAPFATLPANFTYLDLVNALGVMRGDQLTFLVATYDTSTRNVYLRTNLTGFSYARIILEPADGDMTVPFLSGSADAWTVAAPNPLNEGIVQFGEHVAGGHMLNVNAINTIVKQPDEALTSLFPILGTVIVSRRAGDRWLRSSQRLTWIRSAASIPDEDAFGLAYLSYRDATGSSLYLNQAD